MDSNKNKRKQLTLFVPASFSSEIEKCRENYNAEQFKLIKAHITLCREDEIEQIENLKVNLENLSFNSFELELGKPIRFSENKGVLIPIIDKGLEFQSLRTKVLHNILEKPKEQNPHITLMHPRNSICTNEIFRAISAMRFPFKIKFSKISLIEQIYGERWNILEEYKLKSNK